MIASFEMASTQSATGFPAYVTKDMAGSFLWRQEPTKEDDGIYRHEDADSIRLDDSDTATMPMGTIQRVVLRQGAGS